MAGMELAAKTERRNGRGYLIGVGVSSLAVLAACSAGPGESQNTANTSPTTTAAEAGQATRGPAGHSEDIGKPVIVEGQSHTMTQQYDAQTFTDYRDASHRDASGSIVSADQNPTIQTGKQYEVDCFQVGSAEASRSAATAGRLGVEGAVWYHITDGSDERLIGLYVPANTAWNQENTGGPELNNAIDPTVPPCHPEDASGYTPAQRR